MTSSGKLRRLQQSSLAEQAYAELKAAILAGDLGAGATLAEVELAEALGISRTPVREALALLRRDGLVSQLPSGGNIVRVLDPSEVRELFLIRGALETVSVREFLGRTRAADDVAALHRILDRQRKAASRADVDAFLGADEEFHLEICLRAGLPHVAELLSSLRDQIRQAGLAAINQPERMSRVIEEHAAIVTALDNADVDGATEAVRRHLDATRGTFATVDRAEVATPA